MKRYRVPAGTRLVVAPAVVALTIVLLGQPAGVVEQHFQRGAAGGIASPSETDAIILLRHLFAGGSIRCRDAADANDDGQLTVSDAIYILRRLYAGGPNFPGPRDCGPDPTEDGLDCDSHWWCMPFGSGSSTDGDVVVFVLERAVDESNRARINAVLARRIEGLEDGTRFGIIVAGRPEGLLSYPASGEAAVASPETKSPVPAFLDTYRGTGACIQAAGVAGVRMARQAPGATKTVYVGLSADATCAGAEERAYFRSALDAIEAECAGEVTVNTVALHSVGSLTMTFLRELAALTGGECSGPEPRGALPPLR